jgi:hypothetical protein
VKVRLVGVGPDILRSDMLRSDMLRSHSESPLSAMMHRLTKKRVPQPSANKRDVGSDVGCAPSADNSVSLLSCWWENRLLRCYSGWQRRRVCCGKVDDEVLARRERLVD